MAKSWKDLTKEMGIDDLPKIETHHEITWWIHEPLTLDQWAELDDRQCQVFKEMGIEDYTGVAGPLPEIEVDLEEMERRAKEGKRLAEEGKND